MSGNTTATFGNHLIRAEVWSDELKQILEDELMGLRFVRMLSDFPDGEQINIPSIGQAVVDDYVEDTPVKFRSMDTGEFTLSITDYKSSATYITKKALQDSYKSAEILAQFVPSQQRALMAQLENRIMALSNDQTLSDPNLINGVAHRAIATGANDVITLADFAKAKYALKKANVPDENLVAIVDPSVELELDKLSNIVNVSNNPRWEGIVESGIAKGMKFIKNVYGFDVYVSNRLAQVSSETISGNTVTNAAANMFFSASQDILPFVGAMRQEPQVDADYNGQMQREEYITTMRYGLKLFRPENLYVLLSATDQV